MKVKESGGTRQRDIGYTTLVIRSALGIRRNGGSGVVVGVPAAVGWWLEGLNSNPPLPLPTARRGPSPGGISSRR